MFWQGKAVLRCNSSLCRWFSGPKPTNISTLVRMFEGWHFYSGGIPLTLVSPPQGISPHIDSLHSPTVSTSDSTSKSSAREMEERCLVIFFCRGNSFLFVDTFKIRIIRIEENAGNARDCCLIPQRLQFSHQLRFLPLLRSSWQLPPLVTGMVSGKKMMPVWEGICWECAIITSICITSPWFR